MRIGPHATSVSLEAPFWDELRALAGRRGLSVAALVAEVDAGRTAGTNLSSALRLFVLDRLRAEAGANAAGSG